MKIFSDTVMKAKWAKIIPFPKAAEGLVYNGHDQIGVPAGEGYHIEGNVQKNAGDYLAIATLNDGYV